MTETTVRRAVLDLLRAEGVETVFGNPGSTELTFLQDWPNDLRYVLGLQEATVVAMADGYAQGTGRPAFVNLHSAVGVGHALGNIFTAFRNQTPLVITAGQQARSLLPRAPYLYSERPTEFPPPLCEVGHRTRPRGGRAGRRGPGLRARPYPALWAHLRLRPG